MDAKLDVQCTLLVLALMETELDAQCALSILALRETELNTQCALSVLVLVGDAGLVVKPAYATVYEQDSGVRGPKREAEGPESSRRVTCTNRKSRLSRVLDVETEQRRMKHLHRDPG